MKNNRMILLAISLIILCFTLTTTVSTISLSSVISDDSQEVSKLLATKIHDSITNELVKPITVGKTMANDIFLIDEIKNEHLHSTDEVEENFKLYLKNLKTNFNYESAFIVSDLSKKYYTYKGLNKIVDTENNPHDIWYKIFVDSNKQYDLDVDVDEVNKNQWTVFINARIEDSDKNFLGTCGVGVQMKSLQELFSKYEEEYNIKINLVNPAGLVQVDTDEINIEAAVLDTIEISADISPDFIYTPGKKKGTYTITKYIEDLGWFLVITDNHGMQHNLSSMLFWNFVAFAIIILILFVACRIIVYRETHLKTISEIDNMTGVYNRRAYENFLANLRQEKNLDKITVFVFDVNELKPTNDKYGHDAGDELIRAAATHIKQFSEEHGYTFRTGGDEFVTITNEELDAKYHIESFKSKIKTWKGVFVPELSISVGYATGNETTATIDEIIKHADRAMYRDKESYYQQSGRDRRRSSDTNRQ